MPKHWILILLAVAIGSGCQKKEQAAPAIPPKPTPTPPSVVAPLGSNFIATAHFIGARQISSATNVDALKTIWALPASLGLRDHILAKFASAPYFLLRQRTANTNDFASTLRPLLDDLFQEESFLEIRGLTNQTPELSLAIRLNDSRAQVWQSNLTAILNGWTALQGKEIEVEGLKGWELKKHDPPNLFRMMRAGDWLVIGVGQDQLALQSEVLGRIKKEKRAGPLAADYWLSASVDWARLRPWLSNAPAPLSRLVDLDLPVSHLTLSAKDNNVRTHVVFSFAQPLHWKPEPWLIPTNTIREPIMSFSAMQGIGSWWGRLPALEPFKWDPMPNQLYTWARADVPGQVFAAAPVPNATNILEQLGPKLAAALNTNLHLRSVGQLAFLTNGLALEIPFIAPFLQAVEEPAGSYLFAGFFPNARRTNPPPAELLSQVIGRTNLLYYDWEVTSERLARWRYLSQLLLMFARLPQLATNSPSSVWFDAAGEHLGNTGTELTAVSANELSLVRKGPVGLTSLEMVVLANWLQSTNFPLFPQPAPPRARPRKKAGD